MPDSTHSPHLTLFWYGLTIFLSSAVLLVIEITAARLIAPYVGVTLYSWTSIIGVVLAGLSLGNWVGGVWADRGARPWHVGLTLVLSGLFCLLSLLILTYIAPGLQASRLDLVSSSFVYALSMFFVPSVLLGIPTPLLTTMALAMDARTGHIVGRMHALAALGSISGTFLTGFVLIQYFGSRNIIIMSASMLFVLALPFLRRERMTANMLLFVLCVSTASLTGLMQGFKNPCDKESSYFCLRVVDMSEQAPYGTAKALVLDHLVHGINHESEPELLISPYVHLMDELIRAHFDAPRADQLRYYFAGGGSFTHPRAVRATQPQASVTVAELDPAVTELVSEHLFVDTRSMHILHGDARAALARLPAGSFDVIVTDAFHDIAIPYHLVTREFMQLARSRMADDGLFVTNVVDAFPDPRMVKSLVRTLREVFPEVDVWVEQVPQTPQRLTYVIAAAQHSQDSNLLESRHGYQRRWFRIDEPLEMTGTRMADLPVFSDDYVPVERMISGLLLSAEGL
jgi:predicted membrane-bound spermidine synthase